jgi:hypothetical protein
MVYTTEERTVLIPKNPVVGTKEIALLTSDVNFIDGNVDLNGRRAKPAAVIVHSPSDTPISPFNMTPLFDRVRSSSYMVAQLFTTSLDHMIVFRGENTPLWNPIEARANAMRWHGLVKSRSKEFIEPGMTLEQGKDIYFRVIKAIVRDIARKYDLKTFIASLGEDVLKKQPPI